GTCNLTRERIDESIASMEKPLAEAKTAQAQGWKERKETGYDLSERNINAIKTGLEIILNAATAYHRATQILAKIETITEIPVGTEAIIKLIRDLLKDDPEKSGNLLTAILRDSSPALPNAAQLVDPAYYIFVAPLESNTLLQSTAATASTPDAPLPAPTTLPTSPAPRDEPTRQRQRSRKHLITYLAIIGGAAVGIPTAAVIFKPNHPHPCLLDLPATEAYIPLNNSTETKEGIVAQALLNGTLKEELREHKKELPLPIDTSTNIGTLPATDPFYTHVAESYNDQLTACNITFSTITMERIEEIRFNVNTNMFEMNALLKNTSTGKLLHTWNTFPASELNVIANANNNEGFF
ncbi:MAG: hypothetical protein WCW30_04835, partial [Candidatus Gracilibacteria bacterium]